MSRDWSAHDALKLMLLNGLSRHFVKARPDPIWIFGIQKAGTTVFAKTLAAATGQTSLMDTPLLWNTWRPPLSATDLGRIMRRNPITFSPQILKEPTATFYPGACLAQTTRKRHVLLLRQPANNIRSMLDRMGLNGQGKAPSGTLPRIHPTYAAYRKELGLAYPLAMAHRWAIAHENAVWDDPNIGIFTYEGFLADPDRTLKAAANHVGLAITSNFQSTLNQQHQPAGKNRQQLPEDFFKPEMLQKIQSITAPAYERLLERAFD
jgi:hypothetical protein